MWGKLAIINLHNCDKNLIKDRTKIKKFIIKLCKNINMKRVGPARIKRFGKNSLKGYSAMQFIETSSITIHFDEQKNRAFIDIFSCKNFDSKKVERFSKEFFRAENSKARIIIRK